MAKIRKFTIAAASLIGAGMAQAGDLPATAVDGIAAPAYTSTVASVGPGLPPELAILIWAPLVLTFACVDGLLWLIRSDAKQSRRARTSTAKRRWVAPAASRRLAHLHH